MLLNVKEEGNIMPFPNSDVEPKGKKKLNIFKICSLWCFKYFFDDNEIFRDLSEYYNRGKYRFELGTVGERNGIMKYLEKKGFDPVLIEDTSHYTVEIHETQRYKTILKNSIESFERERDMVFIMKNLASVEEAIGKGAIKCSHSSDIARRIANGDRCIQIRYLGSDGSYFYTGEWIFILSNIGGNILFDIKGWVNNNVDLLETAKIWIKKEENQEQTKYSLKISGRGEDRRCEWCKSFFTVLRRKAEEEGIFLDEDWRCIFEEPVHPRDRYAERIRQLQRDYE